MKSVMVVSGLVALLGLATYPTIFYPRAHPEYYRKSHGHLHCILVYLAIDSMTML